MKTFNPDKELKKIQKKDKNKIIIFIVLLLIVSVVSYSFALYQVRYSKRIIYTKVAPFSNYDIDLAVYVNGVKRDTFPTKDEGVTFTGLDCEKEDTTTATWDEGKGGLDLFTSGPNKCNVLFNMSKQFPYNGSYYEYIIPKDGIYRIELWGANGAGIASYTGGKGGYTKGEIYLQKNDTLYFYVGGAGAVGGNSYSAQGGYNGGGSANQGNTSFSGSAGGGATDVRLEKGTTWNEFNSLKSRIMVAGGGAGGNNRGGGYGGGHGGAGGGLIGIQGVNIGGTSFYYPGTGGTQTSGGITIDNNGRTIPKEEVGTEDFLATFGIGGSWQTGAGGGYYGGGPSGHAGAGGGSSFISGHQGCDAINGEQSTDINNIVHTGNPEHYSGKIFTNTVMIDGEGYNWTTDKGDFVGVPTHDNSNGNGYAEITLIKENIEE